MNKNKKLVENPRGLPIVDATESVVIEVAASDVRKAKPMDPTACALANGSVRCLADVVRATINKTVSYLEYADRIERYATPESATREIISIDRGGSFAVGTYYLRPPSPGNRLDRVQKRKKPLAPKAGSRGATRRSPHVTVMVRGA